MKKKGLKFPGFCIEYIAIDMDKKYRFYIDGFILQYLQCASNGDTAVLH